MTPPKRTWTSLIRSKEGCAITWRAYAEAQGPSPGVAVSLPRVSQCLALARSASAGAKLAKRRGQVNAAMGRVNSAVHHRSAIRVQHLSRHVGRVAGSQKDIARCHFVRLTGPL